MLLPLNSALRSIAPWGMRPGLEADSRAGLAAKKVQTTRSVRERCGLLEKDHPQISQRRQAGLLAVARSSAPYEPVPEREADRRVMRLMDELYQKDPSLGSRPLVTLLEREHGILINRKRVGGLRQAMGLEAIWCRPRTTVPDRIHRKYPYLLRNLKIDRANQVWCTDITYVPMPVRHAYLCAVMDWHTRKVLGWTVSNTMDTELCLNALQKALSLTGTKPEIFNADQGSQSPRRNGPEG